jgi:hypothetical protein
MPSRMRSSPERLPVGVGERVGERLLRGWGNAEAAAAGVLERARPERLLEALAHRLEVDPSVASASGSILGRPAAIHGQSASSTASALTPSCRRTAVAPPFRSRISTNNRCSVPTSVCPSRRASPSGQAGDRCCPAGASVVLADRDLRVPVASVPGGPHGQQRSIKRRASCAIGIASWLLAVPGRAFKLVTLVRTGSVRHRKPLVLCGHERSRRASQNRRSQSAHRYDLGRRGGLASGSNPSVRSTAYFHGTLPTSPAHPPVFLRSRYVP